MFRQLGLVFAALALFSIAGGHWSVLQTVAWSAMLRDYSLRTGSVTAAVEQTFDGQHPCELCREIQAAKAKERQDSPTVPRTKDDAEIKAMLTDSALSPSARRAARFSFPRFASLPGTDRAEQPPTPPPRRGNLAA